MAGGGARDAVARNVLPIGVWGREGIFSLGISPLTLVAKAPHGHEVFWFCP